MRYIKIIPFLFFFIFWLNNTTLAQTSYKILYAEDKLDAIKDLSMQKMSKSDSQIKDYYWNSFIKHEKGELTESIESLKKGLKKFPKSKLLKKQIAIYHFEAGNYIDAKKYINKDISDFKSSMILCEIHEINSDHKKAIKLLSKLSKNNTDNIVCIKHLAYNYYKLEKYNEAELNYLIALDKNPLDQTVAKKLISIYNKDERYKESIKIAKPILKHDSLNTAFLKLGGFAYIKINRFYKAKQLFERLNNKGDSSAYTLKHLGFAELKLRMFQKAQKHLHKAHLKDSVDYLTCYLLGISYLDTENKKQGQIYLDKALASLKPKPSALSSIYSAKAGLYKGTENYTEAIKMYTKAYKADNEPINFYYIGSVYKANLKNNKMALQYYELFLKKLENNAKNKKGKSYQKTSIKEIAERQIEEIKKEMFFKGEIKK